MFDKTFDSVEFRLYPSSLTYQFNIWDIIRDCRCLRIHKKETEIYCLRLVDNYIIHIFVHNLYYSPYSLRYMKNEYLIQAIPRILVVSLINVPCTWLPHQNLPPRSNSQVSDISKSVVIDKKLTVHNNHPGAI